MRSSHANFDSAFSHYQRMDEKVCSKLATRSLLYAARVLDVEGHPKEAANPLVKASHEDHNLRSALLLERAAYCFLAEEPPLLRRFGFYQMLAGHRYNRSGQRGLAIQAYVDVIPICKHPGWSAIHEHLNFVLARQVANIGDFSGIWSVCKKNNNLWYWIFPSEDYEGDPFWSHEIDLPCAQVPRPSFLSSLRNVGERRFRSTTTPFLRNSYTSLALSMEMLKTSGLLNH